jgi:hypothetical protein
MRVDAVQCGSAGRAKSCTARHHAQYATNRVTLVNSLSDDALTALAPVLAPTERVSMVAPAVGCTLVLTDRQLLLVRDGVSYRPRSGVQSWVVDKSLSVRLGPVRRTTGRLAIARGGRTASVFLTQAHIPAVDALVAEIRSRIYHKD